MALDKKLSTASKNSDKSSEDTSESDEYDEEAAEQRELDAEYEGFGRDENDSFGTDEETEEESKGGMSKG